MRTVRLIVEYDGTDFAGWQLQVGTCPLPTVQGDLETALSALTGERIRVRGASRTDSGVHARGQVVAFETEGQLPLRAFERGIGPFLPENIAVRQAFEAPLFWDPRRTARGKRYRYTYWNAQAPSALDRHRTWHIRKPFDLDRMRQAAAVLVGTHDFEAFRSAGCEARHAIRTIHRAEVFPGEYHRVHLELVGNAFVRNMVRIIAGNLREVGIGRSSPEELTELLKSRDRTRGGMTAPPQGLCLEEVIYDDRLPERRA